MAKSVGRGRPLILRVETFGVRPHQRYDMPARRHTSPPTGRLTPEGLFAAQRGAIRAMVEAAAEGDVEDVKIAALRAQLIGAEMLRRAAGRSLPGVLVQPHDERADEPIAGLERQLADERPLLSSEVIACLLGLASPLP